MTGSGIGINVIAGVAADEATLISRLNKEQTKFLGGDLAHTHLVSGLDYALLAKVRATQTQGVGRKKKDINIFDEESSEEEENEKEQAREKESKSEDESEAEAQTRAEPTTALGLSLQRLLFDNDRCFVMRNFSINLDRDEIERETQRELERENATLINLLQLCIGVSKYLIINV